jgi:hypothetical protein
MKYIIRSKSLPELCVGNAGSRRRVGVENDRIRWSPRSSGHSASSATVKLTSSYDGMSNCQIIHLGFKDQ